MAEILIAEDERLAQRELDELFGAAGFGVRLCKTGSEAVEAFRRRRADVVLLDVMMPGGDGFEACRSIRRADALVPIVFHTALDSDRDKLAALELGADDYVLKTDSRAELVARVRRALDRYEAFARLREGHLTLELGEVTVDFASGTVTDGRKGPAVLTRTETDLLRLLASERGRRFNCEEILDALRGEGYACDGNTVYVHVHNLRRKLGSAAAFLSSDRRSGYALEAARPKGGWFGVRV